jgi:hypothetical protein
MSDTDTQPAPGSQPSSPPPSGDGSMFEFLQRPRIVLLMLTVWSALSVVVEAATHSAIFMDLNVDEVDGALGGFGLAWQGVPLAVLYADSFRNPEAHRRIFWLAMVHMGAAVVANIYHLGRGDFSPESIIVPVLTAAGLFTLSFFQIFQHRDGEGSSGAEASA